VPPDAKLRPHAGSVGNLHLRAHHVHREALHDGRGNVARHLQEKTVGPREDEPLADELLRRDVRSRNEAVLGAFVGLAQDCMLRRNRVVRSSQDIRCGRPMHVAEQRKDDRAENSNPDQRPLERR